MKDQDKECRERSLRGEIVRALYAYLASMTATRVLRWNADFLSISGLKRVMDGTSA